MLLGARVLIKELYEAELKLVITNADALKDVPIVNVVVVGTVKT